jgi:hypothetical protein
MPQMHWLTTYKTLLQLDKLMYKRTDPPTTKSIPQLLHNLLTLDMSYTFTNEPAKEESYLP